MVEAVRAEAPGARVLLVSSGDVYGRAVHAFRRPRTSRSRRSRRTAPRRPRPSSPAGRPPELDVVVARAFPHIGPGPGRALRGRLLGRAARAARARRRRRAARRRPRGRARPDRRARRLPRLPAPARPARPAGVYNVASGRGTARARGRDPRRPARGVPGHGRTRSERAATCRTPVLAGDPSQAARRDRLGAADPARALACATRSRRARATPERWSIDERPARADHRHHRPGRLLSRRAAAREGLRGLRHGAPRLDRERSSGSPT